MLRQTGSKPVLGPVDGKVPIPRSLVQASVLFKHRAGDSNLCGSAAVVTKMALLTFLRAWANSNPADP